MRNVLAAILAALAILIPGALAQIGPGPSMVPIAPQIWGSCGASASTYATGASTTAPGNNGWTLTNANLTASFTAPRSITGSVALGFKNYFEMTITAVGSDLEVGVVKSGDSLASYLGQTANGYGYSSGALLYHNAVTSTAYGSTFTTGDIIGIIYGFNALWFSKNNALQNSATLAEIASGNTAHAAATGLSGTFYPGTGIGTSATTTATANFGATAFSGTVPSGFRGGVCFSVMAIGWRRRRAANDNSAAKIAA